MHGNGHGGASHDCGGGVVVVMMEWLVGWCWDIGGL